ncbi:sigma factor-like helix-turn-helix DNA-binding protein [Nocardioides ungokensis]|uniref:sigma factor-like helix-turn-helix DNA-binding protein n=1 Tax=Nocardioides ungokensis TaxID=1643322 RepID=UPI001FE6E5B5|nr:sigma factor-like helix-turn-helix DNA-binding protein [Nocardioides ungokensis]
MRATLVLRYVEDLTEEATARELGCSVGSVKSQTHHAIKRLRAALPMLELVEEMS